MSHSYDKTANCQCARCVKERARRAAQSASTTARYELGIDHLRKPKRRQRVATREEQHARYIDCGPGAWDDRE
jgi:hypothetical protein